MNWLAKINLKTVIQRLGSFNSALLIVLVVGLCLYFGYRFGNFYHGYQQKVIGNQKQRLDQLYTAQNKSVNQINQLEVELDIEQLANQKSVVMLNKIEAEHFKVKKELAFYKKIMAPEKQAEGVVIDNLIVSATASKNHYRFQVILVQQDKKKHFARGYVQLKLRGSLNDQPKTINLSKKMHQSKRKLTFNFQYFQMLGGEFKLPKNFIPELMSVTAILPKNKWQKYHRLNQNYPWRLE